MKHLEPKSLPEGLRLRAYKEADFDGCMRVYSSNRGITLPDDIRLMEEHLTGTFVHYLVIEDGSGIVGCGGIDLSAEINRADLAFGMIRRDKQGMGIGTLLLFARLALVDCSEGEVMIFLETSHKTEGFYRRFGFEPVSGYEARYGAGLNYLSLGYWLFPHTYTAVRSAVQKYRDLICIDHPELRQPLAF